LARKARNIAVRQTKSLVGSKNANLSNSTNDEEASSITKSNEINEGTKTGVGGVLTLKNIGE